MSGLLLALGVVAVQAVDDRPAFRVRSAFAAGLNADAGWAGAENEHVEVHADEPFRLRFEIPPGADGPFRLRARRNEGAWSDLEAHDFPHPKARTPRVSLVSCAAYAPGAATIDLLKGSRSPFRAGAGVGLSDRTPPWSGGGAHGEFEWALVIRRFADGAEMNEDGDVFEFRMDAAASPAPRLRLRVRPGHVGGTFVETPGRLGPWRASNGDLYFIAEPAETSNLFMMLKSSDDGRSWREVDGPNRPPTRDLEAVDSRQVGDTIHILHQVTRSVRYHTFLTSDHPTRPDRWDVRGEEAADLKSAAQAATLAVRSDGRVVAFFVGQGRVHAAVRSPGGAWRETAVLQNAFGPQCVLGADDDVHLVTYAPAGELWHRKLSRDGAWTTPLRLVEGLGTSRADYGSALPPLFLPKSGEALVVYRGPDGHLWRRRIAAGGAASDPARVSDRSVIQNAVDSQQPAADVALDGDVLHALFIDAETRSVYASDGEGPATLRVDKIQGAWVRGNVYSRKDGTRVYGFVYDAGSDGGSGMNRFAERILDGR